LIPLRASAEDQHVGGIEKHFDGLDGCFILHDLKSDKTLVEYNVPRCRQRLPACSTFKIPLALMAFDSGVLSSASTSFKWDGVKHSLPPWNADHTAASWMKDSVVWVSQRLTPLIGRQKIKAYLKDFDYGSQDMSGGMDRAWLTAAGFMRVPPRSTLTISAEEQVRFLSRMWRGKLGVSAQALALTNQITRLPSPITGAVLHGKTGSGLVGPKNKLRLGWFVARLQEGDKDHIAVVSFTDRKPNPTAPPYAGRQARDILFAILAETAR
jgi:beta-lactamase class D